MNKDTPKQVFKEITQSRVFRSTVYIFGGLIAVIFIFQAGEIVGFHKASFGREWGDNYSKIFGPTHGSMFLNMMTPDDFPNAHGTIGKIIQTNLPLVVVEDQDGTEKPVLVTDDTVIRKMRDAGTTADLTTNASVIVIGNPNNAGQIEAKLIRIMSLDTAIPQPRITFPSN